MPTLRQLTLASYFAFVLAPIAVAQTATATLQRIPTIVQSIYPQLDALYKDIHAHPELAFQEVRTASKLATEIRGLGFEVTENVGRTGVVAIYRNGSGPTVLVRTDLDALPMEEKTGLPYASRATATWQGRETFVAHSCGHDIHMASWIGTARTLLSLKDRWRGTLMFVAQPAEEAGGGAKAMLADGLYKRFPKPDFAFALHTSPRAFGSVGYRAGALNSAADSFEITFKGRGGHGSAPHLTIDPITMAAHFISDVQTVVSREKDPSSFGVVSVGAIQAGTAGNIIPESALLRGTIRSYDPKTRDILINGTRRTARAAAEMAAAPEPAIALDPAKGTPAVINDSKLVERIVPALKAQFGDEKVFEIPRVFASEDFSEFAAEGVPIMFFYVGVYDPKDVAEASKPGGKPLPPNHSPFFAPVPEPSITTGVRAMTSAVLTALGAKD